MEWLSMGAEAITWTSAMFFVAQLLGVLSSIHALRTVRTSQATLAWSVGLWTLPIVVVPLYWVFGRSKFFGYREALRRALREHQGPTTNHRLGVGSISLRGHEEARCGHEKVWPLHQLARVVGQNPTLGNKLRPLIDGEETFSAMFQAISKAERYVLAQFYILRDDYVGREFADLLIERARAGITVRLLYDDIGCQWLPGRYLRRLRASGVIVNSFNTRRDWRQRLQINFRNHRKVLVVDGVVGFTGGLNIGDEYRGFGKQFRHWRDTHLEVRGPIVQGLQSAFSQDWFWASHEVLNGLNWRPENFVAHDSSTESHEDIATSNDSVDASDPLDPSDPCGQAVLIPTGPADFHPTCSMMFCQLAAIAKNRLWIATPYLVPDDAVSIALQTAARRGVEVVVLIPKRGDHWFTHLAGYHFEDEYARLGIRVLRYQLGFMHQKVFLLDESIAGIGTTNLDNRSIHLNFEVMVVSSDPGFIGQVETMLLRDFGVTIESSGMDLGKRSAIFQLGVNMARLAAPIL